MIMKYRDIWKMARRRRDGVSGSRRGADSGFGADAPGTVAAGAAVAGSVAGASVADESAKCGGNRLPAGSGCRAARPRDAAGRFTAVPGTCGEAGRSGSSGKRAGSSGKPRGASESSGAGRDGKRGTAAAKLPGDFAAACREIERMLPDGAARRAFGWLAAAGVADRRRCLVLAVRESVFRDCASGMRRGEAMRRAARRFGASASFVSKCMYVHRDINL